MGLGGSGTWYVESPSDKRWDGSGEAYGTFSAEKKCNEHIAAKEKELGAEPPGDLSFGFMKD